MYRDQADFSDMPLDGRFDDAREWVLKKKELAAKHITDASHRASAGIRDTLTHAKKAAQHGLDKAKSATRWGQTHVSNANSPDALGTDMRMRSNIDLCECSRRVQGHLAILYPELH